MKRLGYVLGFLLLLFSTFAATAAEVAAERYAIIIGTYASQANADRQLRLLEKYFGEKPAMVALQEANGFDYVSEPIGEYVVVAIKPIVGRDALDKVYAEAHADFPDIYVSHANNVMAIEYHAPETAPVMAESTQAPAVVQPEAAVKPEPTPAVAAVPETPVAPPEKPVSAKPPMPSKPAADTGMDDMMLYGGAGAVVILLLVVMLLMRKKRAAKEAPESVETPHVEESVEAVPAIEETPVAEIAEEVEAAVETAEIETFETAPEVETIAGETVAPSAVEEEPYIEEAAVEAEPVEIAEEMPLPEEEEPFEAAPVAEPEVEEAPVGRKRRDYKRGMETISKENFKIFAGVRLLVAEDNLINQKVINGLLADTGIEIVMANDGQEAINILEGDQSFQMVLMDAHMPIMDGFEATRAIRANPLFDNIPVIALSGDTGADDIRNMMEAGMEGTLEKPLHMDALYEMMYNFCDIDVGEEEAEEEEDVVLLPDTPELHAEKGLDISMGDETLYKEILNEFVQMYANSDEQLHDFMIKDQAAEANALLLDVHGIAANIGADRLAECADRLREVLLNREEKEYGELYNEYVTHLKAVLRDIGKI